MIVSPQFWHRIPFPLLVGTITSCVYWILSMRAKLLRLGASSWPCVSGTVQSAGPRILDKDEGKGWVGELAYSYNVEGEYYSGFHRFPAISESDADIQVRGWKERHVLVRYRPRKPSISVVLMSEQDKPLDLTPERSSWATIWHWLSKVS